LFLKSFVKGFITQKGRYISLRKSQGMLFENLRCLKMIVPIPLNTQISFKNSLAITVQLIEQTIQSIELTVS